ncbi:MAG TPA: ABC transporter permease subunit [Ktedonobacterales bacterium]|nr:ABC transporter permease subunit [Ktedonobacterales bacterium]
MTIEAPAVGERTEARRPSFVGILRGELFKISRQRATWVMGIVLACFLIGPQVLIAALHNPHLKQQVSAAPLQFLYTLMGIDAAVLRIFSGTFLILLTARLIGMEYSGGTIRVLLARGVGRLELLGAKLLAVALVALGILAAGLLLEGLLNLVVLQAVMGNLDALSLLNGAFWADTWTVTLTVAISMAVSILMAAAVTVVTRSLAAGLAIGASFFAADNIGVIFFYLASQLTGSDFWTVATGDLLGPNLNVMQGAVLPARAQAAAAQVLTPPLVPVTGGHTLLVAAFWSALFVALAVGLTWKRDVTE